MYIYLRMNIGICIYMYEYSTRAIKHIKYYYLYTDIYTYRNKCITLKKKFKCIFSYVCIYINIYTYIYIYLFMYTYIHIDIYKYLYTYINT
jgi:hypothetical protein